MKCFIMNDYPARLSTKGSNIVHASGDTRFGTHKTACGRTAYYTEDPNRINYMKPVEKSAKITCKACIRALGLDREEGDGILWVVREKLTGMYLNNSASRHGQWVEHPSYASVYRSVEGAMRAVSHDYKKYEAVQASITLKEQESDGQDVSKHEPDKDAGMKIKRVLVRSDGKMVHALSEETWWTIRRNTLCGCLSTVNERYSIHDYDDRFVINCKRCRNIMSNIRSKEADRGVSPDRLAERQTVHHDKSKVNNDVYYEIRFNGNIYETVSDVNSAQEAAEWAVDVFDFNLSDIVCIRKYKFEKEILPTPTGIKFED